MSSTLSYLSVSVEASEDSLPTEFRIFRRGKNDTDKGIFVFDDDSAKSVMEAYKRAGTDLMIDLNHQSLEASANPLSREDAGDARGWFSLAIRDGDLWAENVRWTDDGADRLRNKKQRYISPTFYSDDSNGRVLEVINAALTALPATYAPHELVAASRRADEPLTKDDYLARCERRARVQHQLSLMRQRNGNVET